jgi:hypothetical protein
MLSGFPIANRNPCSTPSRSSKTLKPCSVAERNPFPAVLDLYSSHALLTYMRETRVEPYKSEYHYHHSITPFITVLSFRVTYSFNLQLKRCFPTCSITNTSYQTFVD